MAGLRNTHGICPPEVIRFLLDLFKYNDNSKNRYSDNYYRASLVEALGATVTPVISVVQQGYVALLMCYMSIHMQCISFMNLMLWYLVFSFYLSLSCIN